MNEFLTGFYNKFPVLYGDEPYSAEKFVKINMASYFVFALSCVLVFSKRIGFLVIPMTFFIIYGAIGNAIAHSWWVVMFKGYSTEHFTSLLYWILGPLALSVLMRSKRISWLVSAGFAIVLTPLIAVTANTTQ